MLRFLSGEKYIKTYWSVKVKQPKKLKLKLKDGTTVQYVKDEQGEIQYSPEKGLDPKVARARWDELYATVYKRAGTH